MDFKKLIFGTVAGGAANWLLGGLFYMVLLKSYFESNVGSAEAVRNPPDMVHIVLGCVFFAMMLSYIFLKWAGISTLGAGANAGLVLGLLAGLAFNMWRLGDSHFYASFTPALVDTLIMAIMSAGTGAVIGWVLGKT